MVIYNLIYFKKCVVILKMVIPNHVILNLFQDLVTLGGALASLLPPEILK